MEVKLKTYALCIFECAKRSILNNIGDDEIEGTPVPIPNTEVKLYDAEDTLTGKIGGRQFLYIPQ